MTIQLMIGISFVFGAFGALVPGLQNNRSNLQIIGANTEPLFSRMVELLDRCDVKGEDPKS
jgi:hypothetical protein